MSYINIELSFQRTRTRKEEPENFENLKKNHREKVSMCQFMYTQHMAIVEPCL